IRGIGGGEWKDEREPGTSTRLALRSELAVHEAYQLGAQAESQPGDPERAIRKRLAREVAGQDPRQSNERGPRAGVLDGKPGSRDAVPLAIGAHLDHDLTLARGAESVTNEVAKDLTGPPGIADHLTLEFRSPVDPEGQTALGQTGREGARGLF